MPKSGNIDLPKGYRKKVEQLYNDYKGLMFYTAVKVVKNEDTAKDIVHSAFLRIIKHIKKIDEFTDEETKGYVIFIVKNLALDHINKFENKKTVPLESLEHGLASENATEKNALLNLDIINMISHLESLDQKYSFAVFHKYVLGYSDAEIAQMLGITVANVKVRCHRGRIMLANMISRGEQSE